MIKDHIIFSIYTYIRMTWNYKGVFMVIFSNASALSLAAEMAIKGAWIKQACDFLFNPHDELNSFNINEIRELYIELHKIIDEMDDSIDRLRNAIPDKVEKLSVVKLIDNNIEQKQENETLCTDNV